VWCTAIIHSAEKLTGADWVSQSEIGVTAMSGIPKTADLIQEMYDEIRADLQEEINAQEEISQLSDLHMNDSVAPSGNSHLGRRTNTHSEPGNLTGML
jgi:hypothetical protein